MWHAFGPEALAALNVSPSEVDHYLANLSNVKNDFQYFSSKRSNSHAWKQWLSHHDEHIKLNLQLVGKAMPGAALRRQADPDEMQLSDLSNRSAMSGSNLVGDDVASVIQQAVRKTVDTLMAPLDEGKQCIGTESSAELVIEQLLSELETAAAKVADMEMQIKKLKEPEKICERRKEAEQKIAEAVEQNIKKQELAQDCGWLNAARQDSIFTVQVTNKRMAALEDVCKRKDTMIARLMQDITALEIKVSQLTNVQTLSTLNSKKNSSVPTLSTTNFHSNLDSPSKTDTPATNNPSKSPSMRDNAWPHASEALWRFGTCHPQNQHTECSSSSSPSFHAVHVLHASGSPFSPPLENNVCWESVGSSIERPKGSFNFGSTYYTDKKRATSHNCMLKSTSSSKSSKENRKCLSADASSRVKTNQNCTASLSVLEGVDLNTPIKTRRSYDKEILRHSLTYSLVKKAKENVTKRRRWI